MNSEEPPPTPRPDVISLREFVKLKGLPDPSTPYEPGVFLLNTAQPLDEPPAPLGETVPPCDEKSPPELDQEELDRLQSVAPIYLSPSDREKLGAYIHRMTLKSLGEGYL